MSTLARRGASLPLLACVGTLVSCAVVALAVHYRRRRSRRRWPQGVEVRPSRVRGAGDGLFATRTFEAGEMLGEYYGQVLSLWQAMNLENRDYLMGGFGCAHSSQYEHTGSTRACTRVPFRPWLPPGSTRTSTRTLRSTPRWATAQPYSRRPPQPFGPGKAPGCDPHTGGGVRDARRVPGGVRRATSTTTSTRAS